MKTVIFIKEAAGPRQKIRANDEVMDGVEATNCLPPQLQPSAGVWQLNEKASSSPPYPPHDGDGDSRR